MHQTSIIIIIFFFQPAIPAVIPESYAPTEGELRKTRAGPSEEHTHARALTHTHTHTRQPRC